LEVRGPTAGVGFRSSEHGSRWAELRHS